MLLVRAVKTPKVIGNASKMISNLLPALGWPEQIQVANSQCGCQLIKGDDCRVAVALLQAANVLLAEA